MTQHGNRKGGYQQRHLKASVLEKDAAGEVLGAEKIRLEA